MTSASSVPAHLHPVCPALWVLPHLCADISPVPKAQGHSTPGDSPWYTPHTLSPLHSVLVNSQFIHSLDTYETPVDQKKAQPKSWGLCFIQWTCWGLKPGNSLSDSFEGFFLRGKGGARLYINRSLKKKNQQSEHWKITVKENQTSQVNELSAFLWVGRYRGLGSLKSFLWYSPYLSRASILSFSILNPLRSHSQGSYRLMAWWSPTSFVCWCNRWPSLSIPPVCVTQHSRHLALNCGDTEQATSSPVWSFHPVEK